MSTKCPEIITASNLSHGWGKIFLRLMQPSSNGIAPILLSISGFTNGQVDENCVIRDAVDGELAKVEKCCSCAISAMTIFPHKHWLRLNRPRRQQLFDWYLKEMLPRLKARDQRNRQGTYFERMISFQGAKRCKGELELSETNQLDHIISAWERDVGNGSRPRQSALQVSCFDPAKDHTGQKRRGFPCLQQISFGYDNDGGLSVTAYYPTQYIFDRGYGNYLGLAHLGEFMAHELNLRMTRINCLVAHPKLGNKVTKEQLRPLERIVQEQIPDSAA